MSEFTEAVRSSLDSEWRSTREIADGIPARGVSDSSRLSSVGRVLRVMERDGLAEGRMVPTVHGASKEWRLRA